MANAKQEGWSYSTGERGCNRVRAYEKGGSALLEFYERPSPSADAVRKGFLSDGVIANRRSSKQMSSRPHFGNWRIRRRPR